MCLKKNFSLLGMPGSGKSFWIERLKNKTHLAVYDLDDLIEKSEGKSIKEIFDNSGESYFRQLEANMLRTFADKQQFILSCGGGTPCFHNNMQWMNEHGVTIWLDEPVEVLKERLTREKVQRPLITSLNEEQLRAYLQKAISERDPFYKQATHRLRGEEISETSFLKILKQYA